MNKTTTLAIICLVMLFSTSAMGQGIIKRNAVANDATNKAATSAQKGKTRQKQHQEPPQPAETYTYMSSGTLAGHDYVDLGLSVKWATCNLMADGPASAGGYFAWGETVSDKAKYGWSIYKWSTEDGKLIKYCSHQSYGNRDNKMDLDRDNDAAYVKWGNGWRMPTYKELVEMIKNCTFTVATYNKVKGWKITGPNGNSIFVPSSGIRIGDTYMNTDEAYFWTSNARMSGPQEAYVMHNSNQENLCRRCNGLPVRAVCQ